MPYCVNDRPLRFTLFPRPVCSCLPSDLCWCHGLPILSIAIAIQTPRTNAAKIQVKPASNAMVHPLIWKISHWCHGIGRWVASKEPITKPRQAPMNSPSMKLIIWRISFCSCNLGCSPSQGQIRRLPPWRLEGIWRSWDGPDAPGVARGQRWLHVQPPHRRLAGPAPDSRSRLARSGAKSRKRFSWVKPLASIVSLRGCFTAAFLAPRNDPFVQLGFRPGSKVELTGGLRLAAVDTTNPLIEDGIWTGGFDWSAR